MLLWYLLFRCPFIIIPNVTNVAKRGVAFPMRVFVLAYYRTKVVCQFGAAGVTKVLFS